MTVSDGPSPIDLRVSALMLENAPAVSGDPAATMGAMNRSVDAAPRHEAVMHVSLMNISDHPKTVERFELDSTGDSGWRIDQVRRTVKTMLDAGEETELELPVRVVRGVTRDPLRREAVTIRATIVLLSGEVYRQEFAVPIVQAR